MAIEVFAPAKINLTLHVTGQRSDGYHLLDSLVAFADLGDRLRLEAGQDMAIDLRGPFAEGVPRDGRNLVWKAAQGLGWCHSFEQTAASWGGDWRWIFGCGRRAERSGRRGADSAARAAAVPGG